MQLPGGRLLTGCQRGGREGAAVLPQAAPHSQLSRNFFPNRTACGRDRERAPAAEMVDTRSSCDRLGNRQKFRNFARFWISSLPLLHPLGPRASGRNSPRTTSKTSGVRGIRAAFSESGERIRAWEIRGARGSRLGAIRRCRGTKRYAQSLLVAHFAGSDTLAPAKSRWMEVAEVTMRISAARGLHLSPPAVPSTWDDR